MAKRRIAGILVGVAATGALPLVLLVTCNVPGHGKVHVTMGNSSGQELRHVAVLAGPARSRVVDKLGPGQDLDFVLDAPQDSTLVLVFSCDERFRYVDCGGVSPGVKRTVAIRAKGLRASVFFGPGVSDTFPCEPLESIRGTAGGRELSTWYAPGADSLSP